MYACMYVCMHVYIYAVNKGVGISKDTNNKTQNISKKRGHSGQNQGVFKKILKKNTLNREEFLGA